MKIYSYVEIDRLIDLENNLQRLIKNQEEAFRLNAASKIVSQIPTNMYFANYCGDCHNESPRRKQRGIV